MSGKSFGYLKLNRRSKEKIVILQQITKSFIIEKEYSEKDVNELLLKIYSDYVTIRRYLIDYKFIERKADYSKYWVSK